jgi:uncharacterized protein YjbI with pentapeptide repeats
MGGPVGPITGEPHRFDHADLRGAVFRGRALELVSFSGARLDGADFTDAILRCVDLGNASLTGTRFTGARLQSVNASHADLSDAELSHSYWSVCDLSHARLAGARLEHALVRNCNAEQGCWRGADLMYGRIAYSDCSEVDFAGADFARALTMGSRFRLASLEGARRFHRCREVVAEVLRAGVDEDFERQQLVGAVSVDTRRCYREWKDWLGSHPDHLATALAIFERYPESGCREALLTGEAGLGGGEEPDGHGGVVAPRAG